MVHDEADRESGDGGHGRRGSRAGIVVAGVVVSAVIAAGWWLRSADAVSLGNTVGMPAEVGEGQVVGFVGAVRDRVVLRSVEATATDGLAVDVRVCRKRDGRNPIGAVTEDELATYCERTEDPEGTELVRARDDPSAYLVAVVRRTEQGPQALCELDVRYRAGWRFGRERNPPGSPLAVLWSPSGGEPDVSGNELCA